MEAVISTIAQMGGRWSLWAAAVKSLRLLTIALLAMVSIDPALAQRVIVNPSFEANNPQGAGAPNFQIFPNGSVSGWDSASGEIELWDTNFQSVPAYQGLVFAEMNANVAGALYQNICMINGETISWSFAHRARSGGAATQTARFQIANSSGTLIQNLATQASTINNVWNVNTGSATYTGTSGLQRIQFITTDPGSFGNFLDDIRITLNPFIEFTPSAASGVESIANANIPKLLINGTLFAAISVQVNVTGGTATRGVDYTTPGGGASFTITIPAGSYQNSQIPLGIQIIDDALVESSETISMSLSAGTGYTIASTSSCGGTATATSTYTITDNDSQVVLTKAWTNGRTGDTVNLAITGATTSVAGSSTSGGGANNATAVALAGTTLTFTESFSTGSAANYITSFDCRRNSDNAVIAVTGSGLSYSAVVPATSAMTCTFTNSRRSATLTLRKTWVRGLSGNTAIVQSSGATNNGALTSVANTGNETDTLTSFTVFAGDIATLSETITVGNGANYNQLLACTGNAAALAGAVLTVSGADTAIVCTFTNSRIAQLLQLAISWSGGISGHTATATTSGGTANATVSATAPNAVSGTFVTVYAGDVVTLPAETFGGGANAATYSASIACTGGSPLAAAAPPRSLTIQPSTTDTTCTYTNSYNPPLTISKSSTLVSDPVNGTTNPKAIAGAVIRYCILITNSGALTATTVSMADLLPSDTTYLAGSMASGSTCANATTAEDDNSTGTDESDPVGMTITGRTVSGTTASIAPATSVAMTFRVTLN